MSSVTEAPDVRLLGINLSGQPRWAQLFICTSGMQALFSQEQMRTTPLSVSRPVAALKAKLVDGTSEEHWYERSSCSIGRDLCLLVMSCSIFVDALRHTF
jgi:hypothetical protein